MPANDCEGDWIDGRLPGQLEFLPRGEGKRMGIVGDIEIWNDAEHALLLFILDLRLGHFGAGKGDLHIGNIGSNGQCDLRDDMDLSRMQDSGGGLRREARRRDCELERSGSDIGKGKLPIVAG